MRPVRHGTTTKYVQGCSCAKCRKAWAAYTLQLRHERAKLPTRVIPNHGSASTYANWACRCRKCKDAHNARMRAYYHARKAKRVA